MQKRKRVHRAAGRIQPSQKKIITTWKIIGEKNDAIQVGMKLDLQVLIK